MFVHDGHFLRGEWAGLEEDGVRDGDFADIVDLAAEAEGAEVVLRETGALAEHHGVLYETLGMALRERVLGFQAACEGKNDGFRLRVNVGLELENGLNAAEGFPARRRASPEIVGADAGPGGRVVAFRRGCDEDDWGEAIERIGLELTADFEAAHVRK